MSTAPFGPLTVTSLFSFMDFAPLGTYFGTSRSMNSNSTCGANDTGEDPTCDNTGRKVENRRRKDMVMKNDEFLISCWCMD
ncbi:hypothetical protein OGAPHI_004041 [Ogataea philodendri]|uniref:Uncharacterized protein n=1 Tax=Ogataea philodendri TaxID=1378263 RepID=A0A9P8T4D9_9ASCO|nr:uncharacterized protein OGAPHI_004041 [Ogataea philodendri]KAH3665853.1 hypothetical protein OGAPHI_004041 [Ogataea philodendri]